MAEVIWQRPAFDTMDALIRGNLDRVREIGAALREIDQQLTTSPGLAGESRWPPYRVTTVHPLTVLFRLTPDAQVVYVVRVHLHPRRLSPG